jgi:hypothetical protein
MGILGTTVKFPLTSTPDIVLTISLLDLYPTLCYNEDVEGHKSGKTLVACAWLSKKA